LVSPFSAPFCSPAPVLGDPPSSPARRSSDLFRVQESLEQEVVLQRVDISDAKNVCNQRAGAGAAPWADGNALLLRPADEVGDDQEVAGEAHFANDRELLRQALLISRAERVELPVRQFNALCFPFEETPEALARFGPQELFSGPPFRYREGGQVAFPELQVQVAAPRYLHGVLERFRDVTENLRHFLRGFQVLLLRIHPRAIRIPEPAALLYANPCFVHVELGHVEEPHVICGNERNARVGSKKERSLQVFRLSRAACTRQFQVVAVAEADRKSV